MTDSPALNPAALDRLREWGGDKLVGQMVRLYLDNSGMRMDQMRLGDKTGDSSEAEKGSHSLKSSSANIGAERLQGICAQIEQAAFDGDIETVRGLMPGLETAYERVIAELEALAKGTDDES